MITAMKKFIDRFLDNGSSASQKDPLPKRHTQLLSFDPSKDLDSRWFIEVAVAITQDFTPWVFENMGLERDGLLPGGLRIEGTDPDTGNKFDFQELARINMEESCFEYCFGIMVFIILVHHLNWYKISKCSDISSLYSIKLQDYASRSMFPGHIISDERLKTLTDTSITQTIEMTKLGSMMFWKNYYETVMAISNGRNISQLPVHGPALLVKWLEYPPYLSGFPLGLLQMRLSKKIGYKFDESEWEGSLENHFGPISRRLMLKAIDSLNSPGPILN